MMTDMRIQNKSRVNKAKSVRFTFNGKTYSGFEGDTLASALLANGEHLTGRSFKYHRPRGILSAGSEEPNALMGVSRGAGRFEPNTRATALELYDGLKAESQNHWPSLKHDVGAINDAFSMFFSAGFYYKTFMWPKSFWNKVYEPFIRRGRSWQIAIRTRSRHLCQPLCLLRCACRGGGASRACGSA
ncbi:hypothetical protein P053_01922 [Brucella abortus 01-4165]|nr:sarcosine oxidase [Brucella abortus A13334]AIN89742.1 hypothetical protein DM30_01050 [Brucella abortus]ALF28893.1 hypothetical protein NL70_01085 [Brucella abortus 104M]AOG43009.1 hypothetical protein BFS01_01075 [Brucella sp. 2002734562]EHR08762.1 hypothetical protein M1A_02414 [Brucella abortus bv. 1 str. NI486]EHR12566.1 hypothetical protein M17_01323 [Brucella abortus bv. 1 str. NI435a]EHR13716.1 hypothetical protein M19_00524 [Brucella abortus bv. 1 str. NI474]EHR19069.1 hypothetica